MMSKFKMKRYLLILCKGILQSIAILVSLLVPLLITMYVYFVVTAVPDLFLLPDLSIDYKSVGGFIALMFFYGVPLIVFAIFGGIGYLVYVLLKIISYGILGGIQTLLMKINSSIYYKIGGINILDSYKFRFGVTIIVVSIVLYFMYTFFAYYNFNMNAFCYAIGGSSTFGDLIDQNETFKMITFYISFGAMAILSFIDIKKYYINAW